MAPLMHHEVHVCDGCTRKRIGQHGDKTMKCPYLMTLIFSLCRSEGRFYAPSLMEIHDYCKSQDYEKCPLYKKKGHRAAAADIKNEERPEQKREG